MLLGPHKHLIELMQANREDEAIEALAKIGRIDCKDRNGDNLLHHAQNHKLLRLATEIVIREPNLRTEPNNKKRTPLHDAAEQNKCDFLKLYLNLTIDNIRYPCEDIDCRDEKDKSALHLASMKGHGAAVDLLLKAGINVYARDKGNYTAFDYAFVLGYTAIAGLLQQKMIPSLFDTIATEALKQNEMALANGTDTLPEMLVEQAQRVVCIQMNNKEEAQRKEKEVREARSTFCGVVQAFHNLKI